VVDASIVGKWYLNDEELVAEASSVFTDYAEGRIDLIAPGHMRYEIPALLNKALRQNRIDEHRLREALMLFSALKLPLDDSDELIARGVEASGTYRVNFYDGMYVALAERLHTPLIHADNKLRNQLAGRLLPELWLEDYSLSFTG
jgi:predicted nucleic acid-binding protein